MKAIILNEAGGTEKLVYQDIVRPQLKNNEVLISTRAIGLNPMDVFIRSNEQMLTQFLGSERPAILGWDIAGEIIEMADDVTEFALGDAVFGLTMGNAYAEFVAVKADLIFKKPHNVSFDEAAATPVAGITAWEALVETGRVKKGDRVLIHAGSGGVGSIAIQIAKHFGAYVISTSSSVNRDFVLSLGADEHIDYRNEKFEEIVRNIDLVIDTVGGDTRLRSIDVIRANGMIVSIVPVNFEEAAVIAKEKGVDLKLLIGEGNKAELAELAQLLESGVLKIHVSGIYAFSEMAEAHEAIASGRTVGKLVAKL